MHTSRDTYMQRHKVPASLFGKIKYTTVGGKGTAETGHDCIFVLCRLDLTKLSHRALFANTHSVTINLFCGSHIDKAG